MIDHYEYYEKSNRVQSYEITVGTAWIESAERPFYQGSI